MLASDAKKVRDLGLAFFSQPECIFAKNGPGMRRSPADVSSCWGRDRHFYSYLDLVILLEINVDGVPIFELKSHWPRSIDVN
jgi:hypothetical protein